MGRYEIIALTLGVLFIINSMWCAFFDHYKYQEALDLLFSFVFIWAVISDNKRGGGV